MRASLTSFREGPQFGAPTQPAPPRASTWLTPRERTQADAATGPHVALLHRDSLGAIMDDLRGGTADAVLVSAATVRPTDAPILARAVHGYPAVRFVGLVTEATDEGRALAAAHLFGRSGVSTLADCRALGGWATLRAALAPEHLSDAFQRECVAAVLAELTEAGRGRALGTTQAGGGFGRFLTHTFAPDVTCVGALAARLGVGATTLTSRFFRAGLPSPRRYLTWARLVWAARLGESPALTVAAIADRLDASSPHGFSRSLRLHTGCSPTEFRRRFTGAAMLDRFCAVLVAPYRERLRDFDPIRADAWTPTHRVQPVALAAFPRAA